LIALKPSHLFVIPGPPAMVAGGIGLRLPDCKRERRRHPQGEHHDDASQSILLFNEEQKWIPGCAP